ncbi:MAG: S1 RNA-binding domain-containing protein, partial [Mesorhizobium sp.]
MPNKMLIDASHPEETRVVVVRGNRIEEFDFESQDKKQLKGNIYLARVTRVEPSLQAAFVEYGGNRHGFLAFSEIHPDYYQIPVADRQALLRAEAQEADDEEDEEAETGEEQQARDRGGRRNRRRGGKNRDRAEQKRGSDAAGADEGGESADEVAASSASADEPGDAADTSTEATEGSETVETVAEAAGEEENKAPEAGSDTEDADATDSENRQPSESGPTSIAASIDADVISEPVQAESTSEVAPAEEAAPSDDDRGMLEEVSSAHSDEHEIESVGAEDALEEVRNRRKPVRRQYKIQEVIKRRQILLVQVVKE